MGKVEKQNNSAMVITLKNDKVALVAMKKDMVIVSWGGLKDPKDIDIEEFKDASEEDDPSNISYGYLNNLFPDKNIIEVDSMVVDTVVAE